GRHGRRRLDADAAQRGSAPALIPSQPAQGERDGAGDREDRRNEDRAEVSEHVEEAAERGELEGDARDRGAAQDADPVAERGEREMREREPAREPERERDRAQLAHEAPPSTARKSGPATSE